MNRLLTILFFALISHNVQAEIYKWVDENGKVQYGDRKNFGGSSSAKRINISDKYSIKHIKALDPIKNEEGKPTRNISISELNINLPDSENRKKLIGRVTCGRAIDLYWTKGKSVLDRDYYLGKTIADTFNKYGYIAENKLGLSPNPGSLEITVEIVNVMLNVCDPNQTKGKYTKDASYISIRWKAFDPLTSKIVFKGSSKGSNDESSYPPIEEGTRKSVSKAVEVATQNLLANKDFIASMKYVDTKDFISQAKKRAKNKENISLDIQYGHGQNTFNDSAQQLKNSTVIVKVDGGHGSGVIASTNGYVLTNAHVVGDHTEVKVKTVNRTYTANVVGRSTVRDVAILKMRDYSGSYVPPLVKGKSKIGEEIFVIGTPLDESFSHTITKGIISAERNRHGLAYYQTDASINMGNSGGPVFNNDGELIALTVSGIFANNGATLNLNYLIPIDDAFDFLNIKVNSGSDPLGAIRQLGANSNSPFIQKASKALFNLLDKPIIDLNDYL